MFKTCVIKNSKRKKTERIEDICIELCSTEHPGERSFPYFEVVHEQVLSDSRYLSLTPQQQGQFWRLIVHVVAPKNGLIIRHVGAIAKRLHMERSEWECLERVLLQVGLLVTDQEGDFLIQHELREQYLQTLEVNNNKRRYQYAFATNRSGTEM